MDMICKKLEYFLLCQKEKQHFNNPESIDFTGFNSIIINGI